MAASKFAATPVGLAVTPWSNFGTGAAVQVVTGAKQVRRVLGGNGTSTLYYLQVHDTNGVPSGGAVPLISVPVGIGIASSPTENDRLFDPNWVEVSSGIYVAWSSTEGTYTAVTPAAQYIEVDYV